MKPDEEFIFDVRIEIPKGSRNKYEYDHASGEVRFDRMLFSAMQYPSDYGFIINTLAGDGDPLDAMVLVWEPTFSGCLIRSRAVGLLNMSDEKKPDEKILCIPINDPMWNQIKRLDDVPKHLLIEIEHFFRVYKDLEAKETEVFGWDDSDAAIRVVKEAQENYFKSRP